MNDQPTLFDIDQYDVTPKLTALFRGIKNEEIKLFSIDSFLKMSKLYGVSCETILDVKEKVTNEKI